MAGIDYTYYKSKEREGGKYRIAARFNLIERNKVMPMKNKAFILTLLVVFQFVLFSCRKTKEANQYRMYYSIGSDPIDYRSSQYHTLLIVHFTKKELKIFNVSSEYNSPISVFNINKEKLTGTLMEIVSTYRLYPPHIDTIYYELDGKATRKRIWGNYKQIRNSSFVSYGTFDMDLTKP